MSDPSRWPVNPASYPTSTNLYLQQQQQQSNYRTNDLNDNTQPDSNISQPISVGPTNSQQHLRALQPNPYPSLSFPYYPHPKSSSSMQTSKQEQDKIDTKRTRISRAW